MKCPYCDNKETRVIDSRESKEKSYIKRRRECIRCEKRFSTLEKIQKLDLEVLKSDGRIEEFTIEKLKKSIIKSCVKRPVTLDDVEVVAQKSFEDLKLEEQVPIPTKSIAKVVLRHLKELDDISFLRFAIVHNNYATMEEFSKEMTKLKKFS